MFENINKVKRSELADDVQRDLLSPDDHQKLNSLVIDPDGGGSTLSHHLDITVNATDFKYDGSKDVSILIDTTTLGAATADHEHPPQINITGNAATANRFFAPINIGNASFDGSKDVTLMDIGAASSSHTHDDKYAAKDHDHNDTYSPKTHNHDDKYASKIHNHDDVYSLKAHNHDSIYATIEHTQAAITITESDDKQFVSKSDKNRWNTITNSFLTLVPSSIWNTVESSPNCYFAKINVEGLKSTDDVKVYLHTPIEDNVVADIEVKRQEFSLIFDGDTQNDYLMLYCMNSKPTRDLLIWIEGITVTG